MKISTKEFVAQDESFGQQDNNHRGEWVNQWTLSVASAVTGGVLLKLIDRLFFQKEE